jgi:hypothetical protein
LAVDAATAIAITGGIQHSAATARSSSSSSRHRHEVAAVALLGCAVI